MSSDLVGDRLEAQPVARLRCSSTSCENRPVVFNRVHRRTRLVFSVQSACRVILVGVVSESTE